MLDKVTGMNQFQQTVIKPQHEKTVGNHVKEQEVRSENSIKPPDGNEMEEMVQGMNDFLKPVNTHLKFEFHDELKEYYVSIVDNDTQEIVKEIPPKKLLDMYAAMTDFLGILLDKKI